MAREVVGHAVHEVGALEDGPERFAIPVAQERVDSEVGRGSRFSFTLPITEPEAAGANGTDTSRGHGEPLAVASPPD